MARVRSHLSQVHYLNVACNYPKPSETGAMDGVQEGSQRRRNMHLGLGYRLSYPLGCLFSISPGAWLGEKQACHASDLIAPQPNIRASPYGRSPNETSPYTLLATTIYLPEPQISFCRSARAPHVVVARCGRRNVGLWRSGTRSQSWRHSLAQFCVRARRREAQWCRARRGPAHGIMSAWT